MSLSALKKMVVARHADNLRLHREFPTATKWKPAMDECEWFLEQINEFQIRAHAKHNLYLRNYYIKNHEKILAQKRARRKKVVQ